MECAVSDLAGYVRMIYFLCFFFFSNPGTVLCFSICRSSFYIVEIILSDECID